MRYHLCKLGVAIPTGDSYQMMTDWQRFYRMIKNDPQVTVDPIIRTPDEAVYGTDSTANVALDR